MSGWVVLQTRAGRLVCHPAHVSAVYVREDTWDLDQCVILNIGGTDHGLDVPEGESPGDALARVCGLLNIEVTR